MSAGQLSADITVLSASLYRVKQQMGAERYAAAQAALQNQKDERQQRGATSTPYSQAERSDDIGGTLALARAAGIGRFAAKGG